MNNTKNFIMISPNFPMTYYKFAEALKNRGIRVIGIGDAFVHELDENLKITYKDVIWEEK